MQWRGSGGAMTWAVGAAMWVWFLTMGCCVFFFWVLTVDYGLLVVVSGVCSAAVVVIVVLK